MANKIEILENTIVKLLFRRGTDSDRQNVTFNLGEPGYVTDTEHLYVGDGSTVGGVLVGNKYLGQGPNPTVSAPAVPGDTFYSTTENKLMFLSGGDGSVLTSWKSVA